MLVVVSGIVVVNHVSTVLVVVSTFKDVVVSCTVVVETGTVSTTVVLDTAVVGVIGIAEVPSS